MTPASRPTPLVAHSTRSDSARAAAQQLQQQLRTAIQQGAVARGNMLCRRRGHWHEISAWRAAWSSTRTNTSRPTDISAGRQGSGTQGAADLLVTNPTVRRRVHRPDPKRSLVRRTARPGAVSPRRVAAPLSCGAERHCPTDELGYPGSPWGAAGCAKHLTNYLGAGARRCDHARSHARYDGPDAGGRLAVQGPAALAVSTRSPSRTRASGCIARRSQTPACGWCRCRSTTTGLDVARLLGAAMSAPCWWRRRTPIRPARCSARQRRAALVEWAQATTDWSSRTTTTPSSGTTARRSARCRVWRRSGWHTPGCVSKTLDARAAPRVAGLAALADRRRHAREAVGRHGEHACSNKWRLARFIEAGALGRHLLLSGVRPIYRRRRDTVLESLASGAAGCATEGNRRGPARVRRELPEWCDESALDRGRAARRGFSSGERRWRLVGSIATTGAGARLRRHRRASDPRRGGRPRINLQRLAGHPGRPLQHPHRPDRGHLAEVAGIQCTR